MKLSLSFIKKTRSPSEAASEVIDIDVTPVMNMFVILIPFLVSVAVFAHLSIIEFSLPPNVGASLDNPSSKPKLKITVVVALDFLAITYGENMLDSIPRAEEEYDYSSLYQKLLLHKEEYKIKDEIVVAVRDKVRFKFVVNVMDKCREAGFIKVGLSSATVDPESTNNNI